jgi:PAS domain S-box-containing protein
VLDYLPDFVYIKDLECRYVFNNAAHARSMGTETPTELVGTSDLDYFPRELALQYMHDEQQIIQSGQALLNREERSLGIDGQPIWALSSKVPLRNEQGEIVALLGITRDITQWRSIQEKLAEREAEYRLVISTMTDGIIVRDVTGKITACNPSAERILGLTEAEILRRTPIDPQWQIFYEDGSPVISEGFPTMVTLQTSETRTNVIMKIHKPDDSWSWITVSSRPLIREGSDQPYGVVVTITDITAVKTAEQQLRESEERFHELAANIEIGFSLYTYATRAPIYISPAYEKLWGRSIQQLFETPDALLAFVHTDDRSLVLRSMASSKASYEYRIIKPDGSTRWLRTQRFPIRDNDKVVVRIADISEDVTEHKQIAAEQQRAETLKNFLADASHDLHTPLAVANTSIYLLKRLITANHPIEEQLKYVDILNSRIEHIRKQLDDMFTLVRLDLASSFEFRPADVQALVRSIHAQFWSAATSKQLSLDLDLAAELPSVMIDPKEMQYAISTLVDNAIAYTPAQGNITIRTQVRGHYAVIEVEDNGIGIAEKDLPHIFSRFYRVDDARNTMYGRSGLGLTIAEKIVEAHDGLIEVRSEVGKGSVFSVFIPLPNA